MDWLGFSWRASLGAALGALVGALIFACSVAHGVGAAWIVGASTGLSTAIAADERSALRGVLVATLAVWAAASVDVTTRGEPLVGGLVHLHAELTPWRLAAHVAGAVMALVLGGASFRRGARTRLPGS